MPYSAPSRCGHRGDDGRPCPELSTKKNRCEDHQPPPWQRRSKAWGSGGSRKWRALRDKVLRDEPNCRSCGQPATQVDHIRPLSKRGAKFDKANLQPICDDCHDTKSREENRR
ncbi:HNH endonuclease [Nocardiopsis sp. EMB25]|uniref:HNH endonuclease n=1 Tax=Nocardiopsis sp. EMB25 TaxID=2835867 RepID=UPI0022848C8E|nr:HNH endonuclease signature motif containing protein [Nocardiopsis sp. EMB25]MCY9786844.1 HNH endonuclease [Nocardiopsis sp. EMB25]